MAVMAVLVCLILQITHSVSTAINNTHKHMDADEQARFVLDRMAFDIVRMLRRTDIDYTFQNTAASSVNSANPAFLSFYSTALGDSSASRPLSVIGYRVNSAYQLERGALPVNWVPRETSPAGTLTAFSACAVDPQTQELRPTQKLMQPNTLPNISDSDYQVVGDQVFRFEFCYLVNGGTGAKPFLSATPPTSLDDVLAIVVAIAVLDLKSRSLLSATQLDALAGALPPAAQIVQNDQDIATGWNKKVTDGALSRNNVAAPLAATSAVRLYQRYYYLP